MLVCAMSMPIVAFLFVSADHAVRLLLGEQWLEAVTIFQLLGPAAFIGTFNVATGWVFVSLGQTERQFRMGLVVAALTVLAFFCGIPWGAPGVAAAFSLSVCVLRLPTVVYCFRTTPLRVADLGQAIWLPAVTSIVAGAVLFGLRRIVMPMGGHAAIGFVADGLVYGALYVGAWWIVPGGRELISECVGIAKRLFPKHAAAMPAAAEQAVAAPVGH